MKHVARKRFGQNFLVDGNIVRVSRGGNDVMTIGRDQAGAIDTVDGAFMFLVFNGSRPPFNDQARRAAGFTEIEMEWLQNG